MVVTRLIGGKENQQRSRLVVYSLLTSKVDAEGHTLVFQPLRFGIRHIVTSCYLPSSLIYLQGLHRSAFA